MATISGIPLVPLVRHLRSEPTAHILHFRGGKQVLSGRGLAYWFGLLSASIVEIPCDDRDQPFLFKGRSADYQDVTVQGSVTYRVVNPETLAARVDFSIDPRTGLHRKTPLERIAGLLTQLAQQLAWEYISQAPVRDILREGVDRLRARLREGLTADSGLAEMGLAITSVRIAGVDPTAELEKALQAPTREEIQQQADEATFQRRAMAVEKERAIQENELQNRIELARREEQLIAQQGQNARNEATDQAESARIAAEGRGQRRRLAAAARAEAIRVVGESQVQRERSRIDIYRDLPTPVLFGLAARRLADKLERIDHLNLAPDSLAPLLQSLLAAGTEHLTDHGGSNGTTSE